MRYFYLKSILELINYSILTILFLVLYFDMVIHVLFVA